MSKKIRVFSKINITVFGQNNPTGKDISTNDKGALQSVRPGWTESRLDFKKDKNYDLTADQFKWKSVQGLIKNGHLEVLASDSEVQKLVGKGEEVATKEETLKDKLMTKCDELGIKYRKNATEESLQAAIDDYEKEASAEELPKVETE